MRSYWLHTVLVAFIGSCEMSKTPEEGTYVESLPYAGGTVYLRAHSSQTVVMDDTAPVRVAWEPVERTALEIEMRISWQQLQGLPDFPDMLEPPIVRYGVNSTHGRSFYQEPAPTFPLTPNVHIPGLPTATAQMHSLPGRGLVTRLSSRELSVSLVNTGWGGRGLIDREQWGPFFQDLYPPNTPTFPRISVTVSFQPAASGAELLVFPRSTLYVPQYTQVGVNPPKEHQFGSYVPFPMAAQEWRVLDEEGQPFDASEHYTAGYGFTSPDDVDIVVINPTGFHISYVRAHTLAEFSPIPHNGFAFASFFGNFSNGNVRPRRFVAEFR